MEENKTFYIENNGQRIKANIITCFEVLNENYCIYSLQNHPLVDIYCAKIINNNLVKIEDEEEKERINNIVKQLLKF